MHWDDLKQSQPAETSEFLKQFKLPPSSVDAITHTVQQALAAAAERQAVSPETSHEQGSTMDISKEKQFRQRIFELEKMATLHVRLEKEQVQHERQQREASEARLMEINRLLEDKLTIRAREVQELRESAAVASKNVTEMQSEVKRRDDTIITLQYRIEMMENKLQRVVEKEKEVDKRSLRLSMLEAAVMDQDSRRIQELTAVTAGEATGEELRQRLAAVTKSNELGPPTETGIQASVEVVLQRMEGRFQELLAQRQRRFDEEMTRYETTIAERRTEALSLQREVEVLRKQVIQAKTVT